ncbi:DUF3785 family protein [Geosporobacter ferrireducens]|uniref:DUF3785 domain-containing protein n=1 Tax=Geosporobacter ferrireducens TaxID=1424294 RepID=A0A1D8GIH8_9FIRM|nr:DUF3785 family protein [Geosporobacter ferrireducens]AOT70724.1 DUF3785 domain-containing protein [Geosporobacter ferrireducens]MTI57528.1 DUF3785 domain-containing protein [Geosporobacter ferrireducens]
MEKYQFIFNEKIYTLSQENCSEWINDEIHPVKGIEIVDILELLSQHEEVDFDITYYGEPCPDCLANKTEKAKHFPFLEYHFYLFAKNGEYIMSSISPAYKDTSFDKLLKKEKADNSYIASIILCMNCGSYSIEIEQCEI